MTADYFPMHFKRGDITNIDGWPHDIVWSSHDKCIAQERIDKTFILWDYRANTTNEISAAEAQPFLMSIPSDEETQNNEPNQASETKMSAEAVSVADLNSYKDGQSIPCFEGVLGKLYPAKTGTSKGRKWSFQNGYIKDNGGDEHRICFASPENEQDPDAVKGKRVRLTCSMSKGKAKGLIFKVSPNDKDEDNPYRTIQVDEGAKIEFVNGTKEDDAAPTNSKTAGQQSSGSSRQTSAPRDESTVTQRVTAYMGVLMAVNASYKANAANLPLLEGGDLKDIATTISLGYRGEYGAYAPPIFDGGAKSQSTEEAPEEKKESAWKSFVHPKRGKPLGEIPLRAKAGVSGLASLIKWAVTTDITKLGEDAATLANHLKEAGDEIKLRLVLENLLQDEGLPTEDIEFAMQKQGIDSLMGVTDEQALDLLKNYAFLIEEIKAVKAKESDLPD